jgi:hypothetical protein
MTAGSEPGGDHTWGASPGGGERGRLAVADDAESGRGCAGTRPGGLPASERARTASVAQLRAALDEVCVLVQGAAAGDIRAVRPELLELHRRLVAALEDLRARRR